MIILHWGLTGCNLPGDADADGAVELSDVALVVLNNNTLCSDPQGGCPAGAGGGESLMAGGGGTALERVLSAFGHESYEALAAYAESLPGDLGGDLLQAFAMTLAMEGGGGTDQ